VPGPTFCAKSVRHDDHRDLKLLYIVVGLYAISIGYCLAYLYILLSVQNRLYLFVQIIVINRDDKAWLVWANIFVCMKLASCTCICCLLMREDCCWLTKLDGCKGDPFVTSQLKLVS